MNAWAGLVWWWCLQDFKQLSTIEDETLIKKEKHFTESRVEDQSQPWKLTLVVPFIPFSSLSFKGDYHNHKEQTRRLLLNYLAPTYSSVIAFSLHGGSFQVYAKVGLIKFSTRIHNYWVCVKRLGERACLFTKELPLFVWRAVTSPRTCLHHWDRNTSYRQRTLASNWTDTLAFNTTSLPN